MKPTNEPDTILTFDNQLTFKRFFKSLYGVAPFYFDGNDVVDEATDETVETVDFGSVTFAEASHRIASNLEMI